MTQGDTYGHGHADITGKGSRHRHRRRQRGDGGRIVSIQRDMVGLNAAGPITIDG